MSAGRTVNADNKDWGTPKCYVDAVRECLGSIELDPCSNEWSIVNAAVEYRRPKHNGLNASWDFSTIYVNPPYGADREAGTTIRDWLRRCALAHEEHGAEVLALVPVATNTKHWKLHVWSKAVGVAFLYDTRLRFLVRGKGGGKGAPMSCAMVYWGTHYARFGSVFSRFGAVVNLEHLHGAVGPQKPERYERNLFTGL
jgi:DNA N-6-adenine-methyltransferase (Dam)